MRCGSLDQLALLQALFSEILVPAEVEAEFLATQTAPRRSALEGATWLRVVALANPRRALVYSGLDHGEAAVLALAEERGRLVIMDERRGRQYARRLQLPLTGTLGVLLLAKERSLISRIAPLIEQLQAPISILARSSSSAFWRRPGRQARRRTLRWISQATTDTSYKKS